MQSATTTIIITLVPALSLTSGPITINGVNRSFTPLLASLSSEPPGMVSESVSWNMEQQAIYMQIASKWMQNIPVVISFRVTNAGVNTRATLSVSVNNTNTVLQPSVFICNQPGLIFSSISESSAVQGQPNQIYVTLQFNYEIVQGTTITISGLTNTSTPDNDQLPLQGGVSYLLGYSGIWRQESGSLVVEATGSLNIISSQILISFTIQNAFSAIHVQRNIRARLGRSASSGTCGGLICDLASASESSSCQGLSPTNPYVVFSIDSPADFLMFQDYPRFPSFEVHSEARCRFC